MADSLDRLKADVLRAAVNGLPSRFSIVIEGSTVLISFSDSINTGARKQPELIVELLRSDVDLTSELRGAIADLIEESVGLKKRRGRPSYGSSIADPKNYDAAERVINLVDNGKTRDNAIILVASECGIGESNLKNMYYELRRAMEAK